MNCKFSHVKLSSKSQTFGSTSTQHLNNDMQVSFLTTTVHQLLRPCLFKCSNAHLWSFVMNWQEFLELTSVSISKASTKIVSTKSVEVESGEEDAQPSKSQIKKDKKISAQSSQIKDLWSKLDQAVAENSQIWELLSPATLTMAFTNALTASKTSFTNKSHYSTCSNLVKANLFWGSAIHPSSQQERMVLLTQNSLAGIAKTQAISLRTVSGFKLEKQFLTNQDKLKEGLN